MHSNKSAILLSGGMDSMCVAYWKRPDYAITIDYGQQSAQSEINASRYVAEKIGIPHFVIETDCAALGSGLLAGKKSVPDSPTEEWWPYRNQLILTLACMKAISLGIGRLYIGTVKTDAIHKDGTKPFIETFSRLTAYQEGGIVIEAPAIDMTTEELVKMSNIPMSMLLHSFSCHSSNTPCLKCPGCTKNMAVRKMFNID